MLIITAFIDYYKRIIPNALVAVLLLLFIAEALLIPVDLIWRLLTAALILLIGIALNAFSNKYYGKDAIGYGDIKLLSSLALLFGGFVTLAGLWFSSAIGLTAWVFMRKYSAIYKYEAKIPLGFFISFGTMFTALYKYELYGLYETIIFGR
ncbi:MAG TPA: prepilin peptidase [Ignavibacteriales bacterium]|nr:prepilin peptidase [Ignavibacteriales bacterium]